MKNKAKILFVDDDERICRLVKRYVEKNNFDMIYAHSGKEAHALLHNNTVALILLDVMLPDTDGFTLAREIRTTSTTPIIFLTAKAEIDDKVSGLEIGADDYITKPFEEKETDCSNSNCFAPYANICSNRYEQEASQVFWLEPGFSQTDPVFSRRRKNRNHQHRIYSTFKTRQSFKQHHIARRNIEYIIGTGMVAT